MNEHGLSRLERLFDEFKNGVCCFVLRVSWVQQHLSQSEVSTIEETYLVVLVEPEEGEIGNTDGLPVILHLLACTVDDVGDFVGHHEL